MYIRQLSISRSLILKGKTEKRIYSKAKGNPVKAAFYTLFMAFYELMIKEEWNH